VAYAEKDRTGVLSGRSFVNPTFDSLCAPLLGLLGGVQARIETGDEAASQDAETLANQEANRVEASSQMLKSFIARMTLAVTPEAVKQIGKEITPQIKSQMIPEDVATLREQYLEREKELGVR
jgi:hypothetical protein